jgi:hypothetical protein
MAREKLSIGNNYTSGRDFIFVQIHKKTGHIVMPGSPLSQRKITLVNILMVG